MPCIRLGDGSGVVCLGNPTENVRLVSGRVLRLEWGAYFGPAVETKSGLRSLTDREFRDPNVDAWIVKHGGKSALDEGICEVVNGPRLPPPRRRVVHKVKQIDQHGNSSALCYRIPHAVDLSREGVVAFDDSAVTCPKCKRLLEIDRPAPARLASVPPAKEGAL